MMFKIFNIKISAAVKRLGVNVLETPAGYCGKSARQSYQLQFEWKVVKIMGPHQLHFCESG